MKYHFNSDICKIGIFLICFAAIMAYSTDDASAADTLVGTSGDSNIQNSIDTQNIEDTESSGTSAQSTSTESADIKITNEFRDADNPGLPNPGDVVDHSNYCSWVWTNIKITNDGSDDASITIQDIGSKGFVYYNPTIGWNGWVRFNDGTGWTSDTKFDVKTGLGSYNIPHGATYQVAILGYVNQTGTIKNTVNEITQDPDATAEATLNVPAAAMIRLNEEFRSTLDGTAINSASYKSWVYSIITTTNSGPDKAKVRYQITSSGFTPNGSYGVSTDNGLNWIWNDGSYDVSTGLWNIDIPSNAKYLLALYGQITGSGTVSTSVNQISQDVYNPYGPANAKPKVLIFFDDANIAQYNIAFKYMESKGIVGTAYINGYNVGIEQVLSLSNLLEMNAAGWIIANHGYLHQNFVSLTDEEIRSQILDQINFLINNGLTNGAYHLAYPGGYSDEDIYEIMEDLGVVTGRSLLENLIDNLNAVNLYQLPAYAIVNTTPVSTVTGYVDNAIATDSTVILLFHNIVDSNPETYEYLTSDFKSIIDYIANAGVDCLTIDDLYQQITDAPINIPGIASGNTGQSTSTGYSNAAANLHVTPPVADISITQTASNIKPNYLEDVTFTINVTNLGPSTAENVIVGDWLDGNYLIWVSDDSEGSYDHDTGLWTIGSLNSGEIKTLHIIAKIIATTGIVTNSATYHSGTTNDPNLDNNYQSISLTISNLKPTTIIVNPANGFKGKIIDLIATLTDNQNTPLEGKTIQFSINGAPIGTAITNAQGIAKYAYTITQTPEEYTILAKFLEDTTYSEASNTNLLTVTHAPTTIIVNPANGFKGKIVDLIATLTDSQSTPLEGKTIQFSINGAPIGTAITNAQGIAKYAYTITQTPGQYTILAKFIEDTTYSETSNTNILTVVENIPPLITGINPTSNTVKVALNKVIQVNFNEAIKFGSNPWIELYKVGTKTAVPFTSTILGKVLSIKPKSNLASGTQYTVIIHSNSITDMAGNGLATPYSSRFTTTTPPVVKLTSPANKAINIALNKGIQIKFNQSIKLGTNSWIELITSNGTKKSFKKAISGSTLYLTPTTKLAKGTNYTVIIHSGAVTDTTGTAKLAKPHIIKFTTTKK